MLAHITRLRGGASSEGNFHNLGNFPLRIREEIIFFYLLFFCKNCNVLLYPPTTLAKTLRSLEKLRQKKQKSSLISKQRSFHRNTQWYVIATSLRVLCVTVQWRGDQGLRPSSNNGDRQGKNGLNSEERGICTNPYRPRSIEDKIITYYTLKR